MWSTANRQCCLQPCLSAPQVADGMVPAFPSDFKYKVVNVLDYPGEDMVRGGSLGACCLECALNCSPRCSSTTDHPASTAEGLVCSKCVQHAHFACPSACHICQPASMHHSASTSDHPPQVAHFAAAFAFIDDAIAAQGNVLVQ